MAAVQENGLTAQQERFAYLVAAGELSQSDCYRIAYPRSQAWVAASVHAKASELAAHSRVSKRIAELREAARQRAGLQAAKVLEEVRMLAHSDIANIMHEDGRVKLPNELDRATRAAVKKFKIDELGRVEYEFWPKNDALDKAMRHLGLYERDNAQQSGGLTALRDLVLGGVVRPAPQAARFDDDDEADDVVDV